MKKKRVMLVFGTRPEAIKLAPVILELRRYPDKFQTVLVSTGQHREMLGQILSLFRIKPHYDLAIMREKQSIADILVNSIRGLDPILKKEKPDILLVQGDTSTAFAAGLTAFQRQVPVGHVEAGLRTFNKYNPFPEEMNRRLLSSISDLHFAPTETSKRNLLAEGIPKGSIFLTGNTVIDALQLAVDQPFDLGGFGLPLSNRKLILVTAHRRESFGYPLKGICSAVAHLARKYVKDVFFVIPVHRNPNVNQTVKKALEGIVNVRLTDPLDYLPFAHMMKRSYFILTDSGGIQEEAPSLGKPVLVLRETTERPEAITAGTVKLIGTGRRSIISEFEKLLTDKKAYNKMARAVNPYGDGSAARRIVKILGKIK